MFPYDVGQTKLNKTWIWKKKISKWRKTATDLCGKSLISLFRPNRKLMKKNDSSQHTQQPSRTASLLKALIIFCFQTIVFPILSWHFSLSKLCDIFCITFLFKWQSDDHWLQCLFPDTLPITNNNTDHSMNTLITFFLHRNYLLMKY